MTDNQQIKWLILEETHLMEDYWFLRVVATGLVDPARWADLNGCVGGNLRFEIDRGKYTVGDVYDE